MSEPRYFSKEKKHALFLLANGKCQACRDDLPEDWHADHIEPHSRGGKTDLYNGQALCPRCSLKKGDFSKMKFWPEQFKLRKWQEEFKKDYFALDKSNFLLVATPGAGKTIACLSIAHQLLREGRIKQLVIVCPTDHLRTQWIEDATMVGIHLDKLVIGSGYNVIVTSDYVGIVTTYPQVVNQQEVLRGYSMKAPTLVIFDEIHHCGEADYLSWGNAIKYAFKDAGHRLLSSGTPFRTDNNRIPFARYIPTDDGWQCPPDYSYSYGDALKDEGVVRDIVFPAWDGVLAWSYSFKQKTVTFQDELSEEDSSLRLRTALDPRGNWIKDVLRAANEKLDYIRNTEGHKGAGGLVIAEDQDHAKALVSILEQISGERPALAISEDKEASQKISRYKHSRKKWIVAVRMISEGVDIKRLRVGVYATNITTEMFFRQAIGRVLRWMPDIETPQQTAWFYVPEDPTLVELMKKVRAEVLHWIREKENLERKEWERIENDFQMGFYEFEHSEGKEGDHYYNGHGWTKEQRLEALNFFDDIPGFEHVPEAAKALALSKVKAHYGIGENETGVQSPPKPPKPRHEEKMDLRSGAQRKVGRLVMILNQQRINIPGNNPYEIISGAWARKRKPAKYSTNEELKAKIEWLSMLIERALEGRWDGTELR